MADLEQAKRMLDPHLRAEEGERLVPYLCDAGVPTIGIGCTTYADGRKVKLTDPPITREQMDRLQELNLQHYTAEVLDMVGGEATTHQLVALCLIAYNIGLPRLRTSTIIKRHRAGDFEGAARAFALWDKYRPQGKGPLIVHPALHARRMREAAIYVTADATEGAPRPPQAVASEPPLAASPTVQTSAAAAATGAIALLGQAGDQVGQVGTVLQQAKGIATDTLGLPAEWFLPGLLLAVGALVLFRRLKQRQEGRA